MQILQWLFKSIAEEEGPRVVSKSTSITEKARNHEEEEIKRKDLVILASDDKQVGGKRHVKRVGNSKVSCENLILVRFFHQTLNLKGLGTFEGCRIPLKKKKKKRSEKRGDSGALGGNKVLPIADQSLTDSDKNKKKARMKELLKWAATAKVLKGAALKDDESPKISFRLDYDEIRHAPAAGIGNWITTDSEFVVLEL